MKTILVLEDSSRVDFGGGQKMTLITSNILKSKYNLRFIDFAATTRYAYTIKHQYGNENFVDIGHMRIRGQGGWLSWLIMVLLSMVYLFYDTKRILRNIDYNKCICYSTNKRTLIVAAFLRWRYNIPYVHHAHLVEKNNILRNLFINRLFKCAEFVLCVSNVVKESIGTPNCKLLYNPSNNIRGYKGVKKDNKFIVAFVGSLIPIKGVEYFIDAAKYCPKHIEFRIYGDGPLREVLKKRSDGRVIFMGFDNNVIDRYYDCIDIIVIPTIIPEALPLAAVDAKSVGIPIIVTYPGGQAEIIEDSINGFCVPMKNSQLIATRIIQLSENISLYNKMSQSSYDSFTKFSYQRYKSEINEIFDNISNQI